MFPREHESVEEFLMDSRTKFFVLFIAAIGVLIFGLPLTGLAIVYQPIAGIHVGVWLAWAATLVVPALILLYNYSLDTTGGVS